MHKYLAPFVIVLIVISSGVFAFVSYERSVPQPTTTVPATATFTVDGTAYPVEVYEGETVIEAMRALAAAGTLAFTGRDYPALGFFVDSINRQQNADGRYWFLYVNGVSASAGASATVVNAGDTVEWKYEKEK